MGRKVRERENGRGVRKGDGKWDPTKFWVGGNQRHWCEFLISIMVNLQHNGVWQLAFGGVFAYIYILLCTWTS